MASSHNGQAIAIQNALRWLKSMLVTPDGSGGIYERYLIKEMKVNPWIRPDCCIESAWSFFRAGEVLGYLEWRRIGEQLARFAVSLQRSGRGPLHGSFPFYRFHPQTPDDRDIGDSFGIPNLPEYAWPNDNGKIAAHLVWFFERTGDVRFGEGARAALSYLMSIQAEDGTFSRTETGDNPTFLGADFVAQPALALSVGARVFDNDTYWHSAERGLRWLDQHAHLSGRMLTSYETAGTEAWRPPASETAIALRTFAEAARTHPESWILQRLHTLGDALIRWQHTSGAIRNCDAESRSASLQNDPDVTDLVYTDGYALLGLIAAYEVTREDVYLHAARRLADFLMAIQCQSEHPAWDGSWRGSYHLELRKWHGAANQANPLDEGGMNTAYTGWSAAPICSGLLTISRHMPDTSR